jgi:NAD(P)-dependent dehydrogenase (short-subunit alcohol dehydrogenase family)
MDLGLDGDAALVSASSSGLGKASATALAAEGANVAINGRDPDRLEAAVADVDAAGTGEVIGLRGDLTDPAAVEGLVDRTVEAFGGLDHLVTSAGGPPSGAFLDTDDEDWYAAFDLLVMSVVRLVRAAAPHLRDDGGGTVVTVTSRSVKEAIDALVLSNSVRMGVIGLEKTLSRELAPEVRANAVLPGTHETPRIEELVEQGVERGDYPDYETGLAERSADNPLERIGQPGEFGDVVAFLSSERSSYVNGVAVPVDGGQGASNL